MSVVAFRAHLDHDLDQFVCVYDDCDLTPESMLFERRSEWIRHMRNTHRRQWRCLRCQTSHTQYKNRPQMEDHMRHDHASAFKTDVDLNILIDSCSVAKGEIFDSCPLCGVITAEQGLESHVANHLKTLALSTLFQYDRDMADEDHRTDRDDGHATGPTKTRSTVKELLQTGSAPSRAEWTPPVESDKGPMQLSTEELEDLGAADEMLSTANTQLFDTGKLIELRDRQWWFIVAKGARMPITLIGPSRSITSTRHPTYMHPQVALADRPEIMSGTVMDFKIDPYWLEGKQQEQEQGDPAASRDANLLALDGGGVRGMSALLILKRLMEQLDPTSPPKPCDCFHMIGGSSTGG